MRKKKNSFDDLIYIDISIQNRFKDSQFKLSTLFTLFLVWRRQNMLYKPATGGGEIIILLKLRNCFKQVQGFKPAGKY